MVVCMSDLVEIWLPCGLHDTQCEPHALPSRAEPTSCVYTRIIRKRKIGYLTVTSLFLCNAIPAVNLIENGSYYGDIDMAFMAIL